MHERKAFTDAMAAAWKVSFIMTEFRGFPKIARLYRTITITEKLDGTNACVSIQPFDPHSDVPPPIADFRNPEGGIGEEYLGIWAQSRKRLITPENDNYGFARWVQEYADDLIELGPGYHFGEWWGQGIQRKYGLDEKRFSLFNTQRWGGEPGEDEPRPPCCDVVPELYVGDFSEEAVNRALSCLEENGSIAAAGFDDPEGIVVYHHHGRHAYKVTIDDDHKGEEQ
jgi:hypothetical protein